MNQKAATIAITLLLLVLWRRLGDTAIAMGPLLLAVVLTHPDVPQALIWPWVALIGYFLGLTAWRSLDRTV